jgi:hypothetical protein
MNDLASGSSSHKERQPGLFFHPHNGMGTHPARMPLPMTMQQHDSTSDGQPVLIGAARAVMQ